MRSTATHNWISWGSLRSIVAATAQISRRNSDNRRTVLIDPRVQRTTYVYDSSRRLSGQRYSDGSRFTFSYDAEGNRALMQDGTGRNTYSYDKVNHQSVQRDPTGILTSFSYDADGRLTVKDLGPDFGRFTHSYDAVGNLTRQIDAQAQRTTYSYDSTGRQTLQVLGNDINVSQIYDAAGNLSRKVHLGTGDTVISRFDYRHNKSVLSASLPDLSFHPRYRQPWLARTARRWVGPSRPAGPSIRRTADGQPGTGGLPHRASTNAAEVWAMA
jgi:YD repeat-containing protein